MGVKITNNASGTLAAAITSGATTLTLTTGQGALFPTLGVGDYSWCTLVDTSNNVEIIKVTARSTDTLTMIRGQDGTTARAFAINDRLELRPTAALFAEFADNLPLAGGTMTGTIAGFESTGIDDNATSTAITIDASENVGVGTASPTSNIHIGATGADDKNELRIDGTNGASQTFGFIIEADGENSRVSFKTGHSGATPTQRLMIQPDGGICFGTDTAAANALDDYEEGTFTPAYTNIGTGTYDAQRGFYTKIGNQVSCHIFLDIGNQGTASGGITVSGLPFTSINTSYRYGSTSSVHGTSWSTPTTGLNGLVGANSTRITIYKNMATTSSYATNITHIGTGNLLLSVVYSAA